jgi:hypothetical protein
MFHDQRKKIRFDVAHCAVNDAMRPAVRVRGGVSGDDALDDRVRALRDERGLAAATLHGLRRSLTPFLVWLAAGERSWQDATLEDVTAYLASRPHWRRVAIARHVQCLRSFFRHAAMRGWVRSGLPRRSMRPVCTHMSGCRRVQGEPGAAARPFQDCQPRFVRCAEHGLRVGSKSGAERDVGRVENVFARPSARRHENPPKFMTRARSR